MGIARLPQSKASITLLIISANVTLRQGKEWRQPLQDIRTRACFWEIISRPPGAQRAASEVSKQIAGLLAGGNGHKQDRCYRNVSVQN